MLKPIEFEEHNIVYAKDQPEYQPLPAYTDDTGEVISCWKGNLWDRLTFLCTGTLWLRQLTFKHKLQPLLPTLVKPFAALEIEHKTIGS